MTIKAIIFGATGMVGEGVLHEALKHPDVESVLVIGRKTCGVKHPKLKEVIHDDFFDYSSIEGQLTGYNACFFCLGVSSVGMTEKAYYRVTYDLTMQAATTLSRLNPGMTFCYITGAGTDSTEKGRIMWARVKGKTENHLQKLPFKAVYLFRPAFIKPIRGLRNAHVISTAAGILYPLLKILAPKWMCTLEEVGLAMIRTAKAGYPRRILENEDIASLGGKNYRE
ncbi:MAG TPA: epimerase [Nitrospirota bacterium]